ncbi:MAG: 50S ribosomal protein L11 methyltransferase [Verrucomicrobiota bacterium]|nr:50S ribosomal protein L11 methyltransferase [Verrucomicrobiota bacterium]
MPVFLWQKSASRDWFEQNQAELEHSNLAVIEYPTRKRLRLEITTADRRLVHRLTNAFGGQIRKLSPSYVSDFLRRKSGKPIRIGNRLTIATSGSPKSDRLIIPAGAAFGTGEHATTAMSLRLFERKSRGLTSGWRMLDAGTGSGILALAAARFGAEIISAIDNDPLAISTAKENARRNRIENVEFVCGDVTKAIRGRFDVIAANLFSDLLITMLPRFRIALASEGFLILSGVMRNQEAGLLRVLKINSFAISETRHRGKWIALLAQKRS